MTVSQQQLLAEVCRLSGTTVFEYVEGNQYRLCGQRPEWMSTWDSDSNSQTSTGQKDAEKQWILADHFPQLFSMQEDLDEFWLATESDTLDLGIWESATRSHSNPLRLRAYGTFVDRKKLFILQDIDIGIFDTPKILQQARERELQAGEQIYHQNRLMEEMHNAKLVAEELTRKKNLLIADVSHELRTPLNIITCMLSLAMKTRVESDHDDDGFLNSALTAAHNLTRICSDLIDVSKIDAGKLEFIEEQVNLPSMAKQVLAAFESAATRKGLQLKLDASPNLPNVFADQVRLTQVLSNLVSNAVKFTEAGSVTLRISHVYEAARSKPESNGDRDYSTIQFVVVDTGIGIPAEKQNTIFEEFTQLHQNVEASREGFGLGLGIVKRLVGLMQGKISVTSTENVGSEFSFTANFPTQPATKATAPKDGETAVPNESNRRISVLFAEDHPVNLKLVGEVLASNGFNVTLVNNGTNALATLQTTKFDVAILDWKMPTLSGTDVIRTIRDDPNNQNRAIPAIALTAFVREHDREKCLSAGFNVCLGKPFQLEHLVSTVRSLVNAASE